MPPFVSCPSCSCAVKPAEIECPHCGARVRAPDGSVPKTAVFALLGLVGLAGCGAPGPAPKYGVPATDGDPTAEPTVTEPTPTPTTTSDPEPPDPGPAPEYGVPATGGE